MAHYEDIIYEDKEVKCSLCSIYMQDDNSFIQAHIMSERHRASEFSRTLVRHSISETLDNFYCSVCSQTLENVNLNQHINSPHHAKEIEKIKSIVINDGGFLELPEKPLQNGGKIKCVICNDYVPFSMNSVAQHLIEGRHRRGRAIAVQALNGIFSVEGSNDDVWCKFCRVYLENYIEVIFEHVDDNTEHRTRVAKILNIIKNQNITIDQYLMDPKEDKARCFKCDTGIGCNIDNLTRHVKGKLHNKNN